MPLLAEVVRLPTATVPIDGLHYPPEANGRPARGGAVLLHGNVGNFYRGPARFLPEHLVPIGIACLAMNRRGHDVVTTHGRDAGGGAFQSVAESMADAETMVSHMEERGHTPPVVVGHSHGGVLAAALATTRPVRCLVLLSPHRGGPQSVARDCAQGLLAGEHLQDMLEQARERVAQGAGDDLLVLPQWWHAISAASLLDRLHHVPDVLALAPEVTCPVLVLRGGTEDPALYPSKAFADRVSGQSRAVVVPDAGHHYAGHEDTVGRLVAEFLDEFLDGTSPNGPHGER